MYGYGYTDNQLIGVINENHTNGDEKIRMEMPKEARNYKPNVC